jgi:hypothetical protein
MPVDAFLRYRRMRTRSGRDDGAHRFMPGVTGVPSKNCGRSEPQRALARTRSRSCPGPGSGTALSSKVISLFPTKWGTRQLEGIVVAICC